MLGPFYSQICFMFAKGMKQRESTVLLGILTMISLTSTAKTIKIIPVGKPAALHLKQSGHDVNAKKKKKKTS